MNRKSTTRIYAKIFRRIFQRMESKKIENINITILTTIYNFMLT